MGLLIFAICLWLVGTCLDVTMTTVENTVDTDLAVDLVRICRATMKTAVYFTWICVWCSFMADGYDYLNMRYPNLP